MADNDKDVATSVDPVKTLTDPAVVTDTPPVDDDSTESSVVCADGNDDDPEACVGDEMKDPWDDQFQTDWPQNEVTFA